MQPDSPWVGRTLGDADLNSELDLEMLRIIRRTVAGTTDIVPRASTTIEANDALLVMGRQQNLLKVKETVGVEIVADAKLSDPDLATGETALAEAVILPGSPLIGRSLQRQRFRERYALQVLGINRHGTNVVRQLSEVVCGWATCS